jgi:membrane-associated phospholipid phosphatase
MTTLDHLVNLTLAVVLIVGGYQFYFWCQRQVKLRARVFSFKWDNLIPLRPGWVWIYSGIYYPAIIIVVMSIHDLRQFNYVAFSYLVLLAFHMFVFVVFPVEVPPDWRKFQSGANSSSRRFLALVQRFDARSNCFPSMHVSVATLTAFHGTRNIPNALIPSVVFVVLIAMSCVLTKQHYLIDLPAGVVCGWLSFLLYLRFLF